ncbi:hypothetical protein C8J57DRAFT_1722543 [Mycena rebaudengoi]|nr:hypothetical protein C8J57DRAFT_1722543 [Mycena rebaudengoi]
MCRRTCYRWASPPRTSLVFLAGPLYGLVVQPLIGALADGSTQRWGRCPPYMSGGCREHTAAGIYKGRRDSHRLGVNDNDGLTVALALLSIFIIDFAVNACATLLLPTLPPFLHATSSLEALASLVSLLLVRERVLFGGSANINPSLLTTLRDIWSNARTLPGVMRRIDSSPSMRAPSSLAFRNEGESFLSFSGAWLGRWEPHPAGRASAAVRAQRVPACQGSTPSLYCSPFEYLLAVGRTYPAHAE